MDVHDRELQKHLVLTTADLRFADILVKAVTGATEEDGGYFDGTGGCFLIYPPFIDIVEFPFLFVIFTLFQHCQC